MKQIIITFEDNAFFATANPPITKEDQIILFSNLSDIPCQIVFDQEAAFGISGVTIGAGSGFTLVYRGVETEFTLLPVLEVPGPHPDHNPTIPPGSAFRRKK
jgi:hypothetical protein